MFSKSQNREMIILSQIYLSHHVLPVKPSGLYSANPPKHPITSPCLGVTPVPIALDSLRNHPPVIQKLNFQPKLGLRATRVHVCQRSSHGHVTISQIDHIDFPETAPGQTHYWKAKDKPHGDSAKRQEVWG